jgi:hypothetical protein
VLFPVSTALYSGAGDECVEVDPALPGPVQESGLELRRLSGDVVLVLCLQGYGVCCGSCGR